MEHHSQPEYQLPSAQSCIECNNPAIVKGYPNALCESCREKFIKYPVPRWIKLFAAGIAVVFLFAMYKLPGNIKTGMHVEKGKTAVDEKRYFTGQAELEKAIKILPENVEVQSYLLIAAFYNQDIKRVYELQEKLLKVNYEDMELFNKVDFAVREAGYYFPDDSLLAMLQPHEMDITKFPEDSLRMYLERNPESIYGLQYYANLLSEKEEYAAADSVLKVILNFDMGYFPALAGMSSVKRQENQLDESIAYCDKILALNKESSFALASKSRTLLKQKHDAEALKLALQSTQVGENDYYADGSLLLAYHFNNNKKEEAALRKKIETVYADSAHAHVFDFVYDVISGKESFRN